MAQIRSCCTTRHPVRPSWRRSNTSIYGRRPSTLRRSFAGRDRPVAVPDASVHRNPPYPGLSRHESWRRDAAGQAVDFRWSSFIYLVGGTDARLGTAGGQRPDALQGGGFSSAEVAVDVAGPNWKTAGSGLAAASAGVQPAQCAVR